MQRKQDQGETQPDFNLRVEHIMKDIRVKPTRQAMEADSVDAGKTLSQAAQVRGSRLWGGEGWG